MVTLVTYLYRSSLRNRKYGKDAYIIGGNSVLAGDHR
jgi:hypothetical protein